MEKFTDSESALSLCALVERHMNRLFHRLIFECHSSARLHYDNLSKLNCDWVAVHSNRTCLYCLFRTPEKTLSCGHSIDDTCVRIFGRGLPGAEEKFVIQRCILCKEGTLTTVLQPLTASLSILTIDGGGSRGVIPLEFLALMQNMIDCPIQDLLDMAVGTSSDKTVTHLVA